MKIKKFKESIDHNDVDPFGEENWNEEEEHNYNEPGICVHCGSSNIYYIDTDVLDSTLVYKYDCDDCMRRGMEVYNITFSSNEKL